MNLHKELVSHDEDGLQRFMGVGGASFQGSLRGRKAEKEERTGKDREAEPSRIQGFWKDCVRSFTGLETTQPVAPPTLRSILTVASMAVQRPLGCWKNLPLSKLHFGRYQLCTVAMSYPMRFIRGTFVAN